MHGLTRSNDNFDRWLAGRGIKNGLTSRRPFRTLMAELGDTEVVVEAAKGKIGTTAVTHDPGDTEISRKPSHGRIPLKTPALWGR